MSTPIQRRGFRKHWLIPILVLGVTSLSLFWGLWTLDQYVTGGPTTAHPTGAIDRYIHFDPDHITDAVSALSGMVAGVLGLVITVVSIIVQLSADRYTGVARMFLNDRINLGVMVYYVVGTVTGVWLSVSIQANYVPRATLLSMVVITTFGLIIMAPYFSYVFWFLEPMNIVARIRANAVEGATRGLASAGETQRAQTVALTAMEELTDITSNSISGKKDKIIASGAVDALKDFCLAYLEQKPRAAAEWFQIGAGIRGNPDFVAMDPESLADLERRRTWVEWKVMRQYLGIYNEALADMRDINYLIAIDTRYIGEAAGKAEDGELTSLVYRFMNSYLRSTLNAKDVRTAYNVLNQYRLLVEAYLAQGNGAAALEGLRHMLYYGHVGFDMKLTFVTETVAYDVSALCQYAHELAAPEEQVMVERFLELDQPARVRSQESALLGVRKAQAKLAAYYLAQGLEEPARKIADDMAGEGHERLSTIRRALESVESKDFWEIIDRGRNFEYMPPEQRSQLAVFFGWLGVEAEEASRSPAVPRA